MKQTKYLFLFFILLFFCFFSVLSVLAAIQPIPQGVHPSNPGNINKNITNFASDSSLSQQISQHEFNESQLDENTGYVDTTGHLLFIADPENNRVLVFDLDSDNVLLDDTPDHVLGQPDFITSDPGTTQSSLDNPNGLAYDPQSQELFVADTNNNRVMVFNAASINNGETAINVVIDVRIVV